MNTKNLYVYNKSQWEKITNSTYTYEKPINVVEIDDGYILPTKKSNKYTGMWDGGVCNKDKQFVAGLIRGKNLSQRYYFGVLSSYDFDKPEEYIDSTVIFGGVLVGLFGHFILDSLSRFWYILNNLDKDSKIVFITIMGYKSYYDDFFELLNISANRIIILEKITKFKKIIVPEEASHSFGLYHREFIIPYSQLRKNCFVEKTDYSKVYLTKTKCNDTQIKYVGEEYFENFYRNKGYLIISPELLPIREQINVISNAKEIVTTLGTLSHLALFAKPKTKVTILTRVNNDTLYPQQMINDCFEIDYTFVDVSMNYLFSNRSTGVVLLGITKYWKEYVKDKFNEDICDKTNIDTINNYFKSWLEFFSAPNRIQLVEKDGIRGVFNSLARVVLGKEIELPKEKLQISVVEKEKYELKEFENELLKYKLFLLKNNLESFESLDNRAYLKYKIYHANLGWSSYLAENSFAYSQKVDKQIEAITIDTENKKLSINCSTYSENHWSEFVMNGKVSGSVGKGLPIFGIKIFINSHEYSIYYRVINENQEISSWFKDGEECLSKCRIFNLQIRLIRNYIL